MKQIDSSQVLAELIKKREGNNISAAARKLEISSQRLGQYVRGERTPNVEFYRKWKEVYGDDLIYYTETPTETSVSTQGHISFAEYLESIKEQKRMAEEHRKSAEKHSEDLKNIIIAQLTGLDQKLSGVGINLDAALAGVFQQSLKMDAIGSTALESLARLEKKKPDALIQLADKRQIERAKEVMQQGKQHVGNR